MSKPAHPAAGRATPLRYSLWFWVAGLFLATFLAWGVLFTAAQSANVQTVPLAQKGGR